MLVDDFNGSLMVFGTHSNPKVTTNWLMAFDDDDGHLSALTFKRVHYRDYRALPTHGYAHFW